MIPLNTVVYKGEISEVVAKEIQGKIPEIKIISEDSSECFGIDRQTVLYLFDSYIGEKGRRGRRKLMVNQGLKNDAEYAFSVRISDAPETENPSAIRKIVSQLISDYFEKFERNIDAYGYPWGVSGKKTLKKDIFRISEGCPPILRDFIILLKKSNAVPPQTADNWEGVKSWLFKGEREGATLNVFSMVCPDYEYERGPDNQGYRYTFSDSLGESIGLVAQKAIRHIVSFDGFARSHNIKMHFIIGMADYEASPQNLKRLGETEESFHLKINRSLNRIGEALTGQRIPFTAIHIRDYFNSFREQYWESTCARCEPSIRESLDRLDPREVEQMINKRSKLYKRWFGEISNEEIKERIIKQGVEYTACGEIFFNNFENLLVLGVNSINMEYFYRLRALVPVIYFSRVFD